MGAGAQQDGERDLSVEGGRARFGVVERVVELIEGQFLTGRAARCERNGDRSAVGHGDSAPA